MYAIVLLCVYLVYSCMLSCCFWIFVSRRNGTVPIVVSINNKSSNHHPCMVNIDFDDCTLISIYFSMLVHCYRF